MTVPGYSAYRSVLTVLGLELVEVRVEAETRFVPRWSACRCAARWTGWWWPVHPIRPG